MYDALFHIIAQTESIKKYKMTRNVPDNEKVLLGLLLANRCRVVVKK